MIQVVMVAESTRLQCMLKNYGIETQTPTQVEPVQVCPPGELVRVLENMGKSSRASLSSAGAGRCSELGRLPTTPGNERKLNYTRAFGALE